MGRPSLLPLCLLAISYQLALAEERHADNDSLHKLARSYLGIAYRKDGATDRYGHYVTFAQPANREPDPGFNCSGFVIDFARTALGVAFELNQVTFDRQHNSGPGAARGEDWDFGRDLILNITEGRPRQWVGPSTEMAEDGWPAVGFSLHDKHSWQAVLAQLEYGQIYFGSFSKPWYGEKPYHLLHFHVGFILKESDHQIWLYHATRLSGVHRYNLASPKGMAQLNFQFPQSVFGAKHLLLIGVDP